MSPVDPTSAQVSALAASSHEGPVQMINLLRFRPDGGREGYARYMEAVTPHLEAVGAHVVALGAARVVVIGDTERPWWDAILTVEYPSVAAFLQMVTSEHYQAITHLRTDALERAELIATAPGTIDA